MRLVDEAEIYCGIFGHRYGYISRGHDVSITELEYRRARERGLPCLIFLMRADHLLEKDDVDVGPSAEAVARLKATLETGKWFNTIAPLETEGLAGPRVVELL